MIYANNIYAAYHRTMQSAQLQTANQQNEMPGETSVTLKDIIIALRNNPSKKADKLRRILNAFVDNPEKQSTRLMDVFLALIKNPDKQSDRLLELLLNLTNSPENSSERLLNLLLDLINSPDKQSTRLIDILIALIDGSIKFPDCYLDFSNNIGDNAAEYQLPADYWLPKLKSLDMAIGSENYDLDTGTLKFNTKFAWLCPAFRFIHVMIHPEKEKAWIIPMQGGKVDAHPQDKDNFHLKLSDGNLAKYKELSSQGYTSQGIWLQTRKGEPHPFMKLMSQNPLNDPKNPQSYFNRIDFVGDLSNWIENEINNPTENTIQRAQLEDGGTPYAMLIRLPTSTDKNNPRMVYLFAKILRSEKGAIQEITLPYSKDIIDLLFKKMTHCGMLRSTLEDIPGMKLSIDYSAGPTKSQPDRKELIINPSRAQHGVYDGFIGLIWHIALHLIWHGDDPATPYIKETDAPLHDKILSTPFEVFKRKFHTIMGKANNYVLNFLEGIKGTDSEELYSLLAKYRDSFFQNKNGSSLLPQVQQYYKNNEPEKSGALIDPEGKLAQKVYNRLQENAKHPMPNP